MQAIQEYQQLKSFLVTWYELDCNEHFTVEGLLWLVTNYGIQALNLESVIRQICWIQGDYDVKVLYDYFVQFEGFFVDGYMLEGQRSKGRMYWKVAHFKDDVKSDFQLGIIST
jgi:hypothetical protein